MLGVNARERRYPRVAAAVLYRVEGLTAVSGHRRVTDVSVSGMRVYSDHALTPGRRLEMSLFLPAGVELVVSGRVVWVRALDAAAPAAFDIGIEFMDLVPADMACLTAVLGSGSAEMT